MGEKHCLIDNAKSVAGQCLPSGHHLSYRLSGTASETVAVVIAPGTRLAERIFMCCTPTRYIISLLPASIDNCCLTEMKTALVDQWEKFAKLKSALIDQWEKFAKLKSGRFLGQTFAELPVLYYFDRSKSLFRHSQSFKSRYLPDCLSKILSASRR